MSKILYAASTMSHINNFHRGYIEALISDGHEVLVMASGEGADFNIPFEKKMLSKKNSECRREIKKILKREKFDAIVLNTALAAFHIRLALPRKNRPRVVNIVHGYLFGKGCGFLKNLVMLSAEKLLAGKTDSNIVMNGEDFAIAEKHRLSRVALRMTRGMGATAYDEKIPREQIRAELGAEDSWVMLFVGELSGRKNQAQLIRSLPDIRKNIKNAELWLVGEGGAEAELKALAKELKISESVRFLGRRDNPCDFIRAADLYVSASKIEGMPFNIIEALGCGAKVLISDIKGHRDVVTDSVSGFLYPLKKPEIFATKAFAIYRDMITTDEDAVREAYLAYSKENVFEQTLRTLREELFF